MLRNISFYWIKGFKVVWIFLQRTMSLVLWSIKRSERLNQFTTTLNKHRSLFVGQCTLGKLSVHTNIFHTFWQSHAVIIFDLDMIYKNHWIVIMKTFQVCFYNIYLADILTCNWYDAGFGTRSCLGLHSSQSFWDFSDTSLEE